MLPLGEFHLHRCDSGIDERVTFRKLYYVRMNLFTNSKFKHSRNITVEPDRNTTLQLKKIHQYFTHLRISATIEILLLKHATTKITLVLLEISTSSSSIVFSCRIEINSHFTIDDKFFHESVTSLSSSELGVMLRISMIQSKLKDGRSWFLLIDAKKQTSNWDR